MAIKPAGRKELFFCTRCSTVIIAKTEGKVTVSTTDGLRAYCHVCQVDAQLRALVITMKHIDLVLSEICGESPSMACEACGNYSQNLLPGGKACLLPTAVAERCLGTDTPGPAPKTSWTPRVSN